MSKEKIMNNESLCIEGIQLITQFTEKFWNLTQRGLDINLSDKSPIWEVFPEYNRELKHLFAILPRHIFTGVLINFQFETNSADGNLKVKWNTGFYDLDSLLIEKLIKIHFLIERHCLLPIIERSEGKIKETIILGSEEQIAKTIGMPEVHHQIYDALLLFAVGFYKLSLESGKKFSVNHFSLYDFSCFESSRDIDKIPDFVKENNCFYLNIKSAYLNILSHLPLTVSEYAAVKSYPVECQRWLELITHWRKENFRQGSKDNEFVIDYKTLCQWMPMNEMDDKDSIIKQLEHIHKPFFASGLLADFSLIPENEKRTNWILQYRFAAE